MKQVKYAIIGAGTTGLTAMKEISRFEDDFVVIDPGPLGTTCARVGCMPSKVFIQVANDFHRRTKFSELGILGAENLKIDTKKVMQHVRELRDDFTRPILKSTKALGQKFIHKKARFIDSHTLALGEGDQEERIQAQKIIIATGSSPIIPNDWKDFQDHLITTDQFFELKELPKKMAVLGLGVIGLEMGQAISRLGVDATLIGPATSLGGGQDPEMLKIIQETLSTEMKFIFERAKLTKSSFPGHVCVVAGDKKIDVEKVLVAIGRKPNIQSLGLKEIGVEFDQKGLPLFNSNCFRLKDHEHIFLAGDVNGLRPLLHEASDQGFMSAQTAMNPKMIFEKRTPLAITFCSPNIASTGLTYHELQERKIDYVDGMVSFSSQGRAKAMLANSGALKVYVEKSSGKLLGAEIFAPHGEHMAHLLGWAIAQELTTLDLLKMPFYHPVLEEGIRTALRSATKKLDPKERALDLSLCYSCQEEAST